MQRIPLHVVVQSNLCQLSQTHSLNTHFIILSASGQTSDLLVILKGSVKKSLPMLIFPFLALASYEVTEVRTSVKAQKSNLTLSTTE